MQTIPEQPVRDVGGFRHWALGLVMACGITGCASMTSTSLGPDVYEIPQSGMAHAAPSDGTSGDETPAMQSPPAEMSKVSLPDYRIEPPDILLVEGIRMVPKVPYEIEPSDQLQIVVLGTTPEQPIAGVYQVEPTGLVNLGPGYGAVKVAGLTVEEAQDAIKRALLRTLTQPEVAVSIVFIAAQQQLTGEHLVGQDGTVNLGIYGRVYVAGMTLEEARDAIEHQLAPHFDEPQTAVDVLVYNSKFYYIIAEGSTGLQEQVARIPITGNETVLDAVANIGGLDQTSSRKIWISRPAPGGLSCDQVLPVDWAAITRGANTATNFQLLPGDRLFIAQDRALAASSFINLVLNPLERVLGFGLLGINTVQAANRFPSGFNTGGFQ